MSTKLLLIEDDLNLCNELSEVLSNEAYDMLCAASGKEALEITKAHKIDICILDIGLPDCSGFDLCKTLHDGFQFPILILTAWGNEDDILCGFENGADDYVVKPCSTKVLTARLRALLKRNQHNYKHSPINTVISGDLLIDFEHKTVIRNNDALPLRETEYEICELLIKNNGLLMLRDNLISSIWDDKNKYILDNTLSVHISRIRKALGNFGGVPYIETVKGLGYRWVVEVTIPEGE